MGGDVFFARILRQAIRRISDIENDRLIVYMLPPISVNPVMREARIWIGNRVYHGICLP